MGSDSRRLGCHVFRATGITAYLEAGAMLENARAMPARTTKLYDRTGDETTLDEVERITTGDRISIQPASSSQE